MVKSSIELIGLRLEEYSIVGRFKNINIPSALTEESIKPER
jgi:hypothetical protein